ncbi:MAG: NAD(P)H-dependent oxidoreductase [Sporolactobacillus sp.]
MIQHFEQSGTAYHLIDLYSEKFDPVLIFNRQKRRSDMKTDPSTAEYRRWVEQADHLIFIYPIWWSTMPAILKGFLDRVLVSGFAYTYQGPYPQGLLKKKAATLIYTMDSPSLYARLFRRNIEWKSVKGPVFHFCGIKPVKRLVFYSVRTSDEKKRRKFLKRVDRLAAAID